jgi:hypothetical protein
MNFSFTRLQPRFTLMLTFVVCYFSFRGDLRGSALFGVFGIVISTLSFWILSLTLTKPKKCPNFWMVLILLAICIFLTLRSIQGKEASLFCITEAGIKALQGQSLIGKSG